MLNLPALIDKQRIECKGAYSSKKRALEAMANLLTTDQKKKSAQAIFETLLNRERLGSTALGYGIAIPHGRMEQIKEPIIAILTLAKGIDFDAPDGQNVDILFALLVPTECNETHLEVLAALAEKLSDEALREHLRKASTPDAVLNIMKNTQPSKASEMGGVK